MTRSWWRSWRQTPSRWRTLGPGDRARLLEAAACLALAQGVVWAVPFRRVARLMGVPGRESSSGPLSPRHEKEALRAGWAVRAVAARTPWESRCLAQALAVMLMLRRRRLPGTLYLGVAKPAANDVRKIDAHAWVRCGPDLLTGAAGHERFAVVASFAGEPPR